MLGTFSFQRDRFNHTNTTVNMNSITLLASPKYSNILNIVNIAFWFSVFRSNYRKRMENKCILYRIARK